MSGARIYNLFPLLAGNVARWREHLPRIAGMHFDWIYLNPFHYPGFSGSLYAVKDYHRLHPLFDDGSGRPADDQLRDFLTAARDHGLRVMMDLVVNHTAKDALLVDQHPEWYVREADGSVKSPSAIDPADARNVTVWGDLAELDYSPRPERTAMAHHWADLVRHYAELGFDGFRCDAAYKVPAEVWVELIGAARERRPDVLFAAETLGCRLEEVEQLAEAGFDYLFNSAKWWDFRAPWLLEQYEQFRAIAPSIAFPESHDTPRLAAELREQGVTSDEGLRAACAQRYLFSAVFSTGVMMPIGYEFGFRRKLDVVQTRPEQWEDPTFDLQDFIGKANRMKATVPAFDEEGPQRRREVDGAVILERFTEAGDAWAISVINPSLDERRHVRDVALPGSHAVEVTPGRESKTLAPKGDVDLEPGEIRVFASAEAQGGRP